MLFMQTNYHNYGEPGESLCSALLLRCQDADLRELSRLADVYLNKVLPIANWTLDIGQTEFRPLVLRVSRQAVNLPLSRHSTMLPAEERTCFVFPRAVPFSYCNSSVVAQQLVFQSAGVVLFGAYLRRVGVIERWSTAVIPYYAVHTLARNSHIYY